MQKEIHMEVIKYNNNKMYEIAHAAIQIGETLSQKVIFNELSSIMSHFNQIIMSMHKSAMHCQQTEENLMEENLKIIEQLSQKTLDFVTMPNSWVNSTINSNNIKTYNRFIARLIESINSLRQKISNPSVFNLLATYIKEIEKILTKFNEQTSLSQVLKSVYNIFVSFCANLREKDKIQTKQTLTTVPKSTEERKTQKSFHILTEGQRKKKNVIQQLNKSYQSFRCLDVDYFHFRSSYFDAKNNELYEDCLERNRNIKSTVELYSKTFREYLTKRERRRNENRINRAKKNFLEEKTSPEKRHRQIFYKNIKKSFQIQPSKVKKPSKNQTQIQYKTKDENKPKIDTKEEKKSCKINTIILGSNKVVFEPQNKNVIYNVGNTKKAGVSFEQKLSTKQKAVSVKGYIKHQNRVLYRNLRQIIH